MLRGLVTVPDGRLSRVLSHRRFSEFADRERDKMASKGHSAGFYSTRPAPPPRPAVDNTISALTAEDIKAVVEGVVDVCKEYIDSRTSGQAELNREATAAAQRMHKRIGELESRLAVIEQRSLRYEGIHSRYIEYQRNALVTHNGSIFIAAEDNTNQTPGSSDAWVLVAKGGSAQSSANLHAIEAKPAPAARRGHEINLEGRVGRG